MPTATREELKVEDLARPRTLGPQAGQVLVMLHPEAQGTEGLVSVLLERTTNRRAALGSLVLLGVVNERYEKDRDNKGDAESYPVLKLSASLDVVHQTPPTE